ncbi:autotransporter-associated beta strand repeat-containing protein [Luteolibacter arcticus]|uniref:Autotransporter-associated beta strand repeat-containing protein n=1 Tax=Luteolibacter arcticus TaxID=1581411 RepID=A0ABT3GK18_9BACT|nr:autotransporter-associated beta strand repeat-containing protein [Luteolibacter arcticus]MCW1923864.1 autotransporter-associated beta strand repeat-containing protein [Luteolibacter arcticus]
MKKTPRFIHLSVLLGSVVFQAHAESAAGAWANATSGGTWSEPTNWSGSISADGAGFTADFSAIDITADNTVHLDSARTIGSLSFGDTDPLTAAGWILDNNATPGNVLTLEGGTPTIAVNALGTGKNAAVTAELAGTAGLTKAGPGMLALNAANTYSGGTTIQAGTLAISHLGALGTGDVALGNNTTLQVNTTGNLTGANTLTVASGNSALIDFVGSGARALGTGNINLDGTLRVTRTATGSGGVNFTGALVGAGTLEVGNTQSGTAVGVSPNQGRFNITNANAYAAFTGSVHVLEGGNLTLFNGTLNGQDATVDAGGYLTIVNSNSTSIGALNGGGFITRNSGTGTTATLTVGSGSFSGVIAQNLVGAIGAVAVTKTSAGTLTLSGASTYSGATTVSAGTLKAGGPSVGGTSGPFGNGSTVTLADVAGATLNITGFATDIGSLAGGGTTGGNVVLGAATLTTGRNNASTSYAGVISGTGGLIKIGTGVLTLTGTNSFSGTTSIDAGTLRVNASSALGTSASLRSSSGSASTVFASVDATALTISKGFYQELAGGSITFGDGTGTGNLTFTGNLERGTGATNRTVNVAGTTSVTFNGNIVNTALSTNATTFLKGGSGTLVIKGTGNSEIGYSAVTATGGTLAATKLANIGSNSSIGRASAASATGLFTLDGGATLALVDGGSSSSTDRPLQIGRTAAGGAGIIANNATSNTLEFSNSGDITYGTTNLTRSLTLGGSNTGANTFAPVIGDNGTGVVSFSKAGAGTWALTGINTYTGPTTINAGTLLANNASGSATGTNTVTVKSTGTLGGTGAVAGPVVLESGAALAPGTSIESLATGDLTLPVGATLFAQIDSSGTPSADVVNVTGNVTLGGTLAVTDIAGTPAAVTLGTKLTLITYSGTLGGTFSGLAEGATVNVGINSFKIRYADSNAVTLEAVTPAGGYSSWASTNAPGQTDDQDYDGDGVANGVEYVLGGLANTNDLSKLPTISIEAGNLVFTFLRDQDSKTLDATVFIDVGTTLATWPLNFTVGNNTAGSTTGVTVTDNLNGTDTVKLTIAQAPDTKKFARLRVEIAP